MLVSAPRWGWGRLMWPVCQPVASFRLSTQSSTAKFEMHTHWFGRLAITQNGCVSALYMHPLASFDDCFVRNRV
jgi:hypothetical protein